MEKVELFKVRRLDTYFMSLFNKEEQDILNLNYLILKKVNNVFLMEVRYDGIPVGVVEIIGLKNMLDIKLVILPYYRYQGIGKMTIKEVIDTLGRNLSHIKKFTMGIDKENSRAIALAKSCGFHYNKENYHKDNPYYDKKSHCLNELAFSSVDDIPHNLKIEINNRIYTLHFKTTYDGLCLICNIPLPIDELAYYLSYIIKCMGPLYTDSMYFTYSLEIPYKANIDNIVNVFLQRGFFFDTLESSKEVLIFKMENPYYQERIDEILQKRLYVHRY